MQALLNSPEEGLIPFFAMLQYHFGWVRSDFEEQTYSTGKRLRPGLCLIICEAAGGEINRAVPAAAAVELVHNFSLIHDDVEDRSPLRRGRETLWKVWGDPLAINAGDALIALAHLALQRLAQRGVSPSLLAETLAVLDRACLALAEGQYLDLTFQEGLGVTTEMYLEMASKKTASLLETAAQFGAMLADADSRVVESFRQFASALGMGFQIRDDILGIWGNSRSMGKGVGEDIRSRKKTLPVVYALQEEKKRGKNELVKIYAQPQSDEGQVAIITALLQKYNAREYAASLAQKFIRQGGQALAGLRLENQAKEKLGRLIRFLAERNR